jgi:phage terminase large subunit
MSPTQKRKARNPTGKGGFGERPQDINVGGAPRKGQSWAEVVKRITDMTRDEAMEYVGKNTRLGKLLKELPPKLPLKDAMVFASIVHYGREPNARMFQALTDREEGKPKEPTAGGDDNKTPFSIPAELIGKDFIDVYRDIRAGNHYEYAFDGGRGSLKSTFVSEMLVELLINNPEGHALVLRQVEGDIRDSVYNQIKWGITQLGLYDKFKMTTSPMEMTYLPTGQKIYFSGMSDPTSLKSIKPPFGHILALWIEEFDQARGEAAVRNVVQSALRGGDKAFRFETWNTPRTKNHWVHKYLAVPKEGRYHHHSTYLTTPKEWLGDIFLREAEHLKATNPDAYEHEYGGIANGEGGMVFSNVVIRKITDKEIVQFDRIYHGLDWGYAVDPASYGKMHYDATRRKLYIFDEHRTWKKSNEDLYKEILQHGYEPADLLIADSAEPKSVMDFKKLGANIRGAEKGKDSVKYSIRWLQGLTEIIIDNERAPYHADEFLNYEYLRTKDGEIISDFPDKANHAIDDVRYALSLAWRRPGE